MKQKEALNKRAKAICRSWVKDLVAVKTFQKGITLMKK